MSQVGDTRSGLTVPPSSFGDDSPNDAIVRMRNPAPATNIPRPILRGAEGSFPFFARAPKIARDTGVSKWTIRQMVEEERFDICPTVRRVLK